MGFDIDFEINEFWFWLWYFRLISYVIVDGGGFIIAGGCWDYDGDWVFWKYVFTCNTKY